MNKHLYIIITIILILSLALSACGKTASPQQEPAQTEPQDPEPAVTEPVQPEQPAEPEPAAAGTKEPGKDPDGGEPTQDDLTRRQAYIEALQYFVDMGELPDGNSIYYEDMGDEKDRYAIFDVDSDGREELILYISETIMASCCLQVYEYDIESGEMRCEMGGFPYDVHFLKNGLAKTGMSHGTGGERDDFWPYDFYKYDPDADFFFSAGFVYQWDGNIRPDMFGEPFPDDVDKDGNKVVYTVTVLDAPEGKTGGYIDDDAYNAWYEEYFGGAEDFEIPWDTMDKFVHPNGDPLFEAEPEG